MGLKQMNFNYNRWSGQIFFFDYRWCERDVSLVTTELGFWTLPNRDWTWAEIGPTVLLPFVSARKTRVTLFSAFYNYNRNRQPFCLSSPVRPMMSDLQRAISSLSTCFTGGEPSGNLLYTTSMTLGRKKKRRKDVQPARRRWLSVTPLLWTRLATNNRDFSVFPSMGSNTRRQKRLES